ncbi:MAG: sulfurtransferase [Planctomycetota bacterium]|nr:sulfurtransferase [Planctomycetota bacterium]
MTTTILNIAAYKFAPLTNLKTRQEELRQRCDELELRGTILLSTEGINMFLAGDSESLRSFISELRSDELLSDIEVKESFSDRQPFTRMLVKLKKEIIAFGIDGIDPMNRPSPKLKAKQLKEWLDSGKDLVLLDTRNDYEVEVGTFKNALPIGLDHFRDFPDAVKKLPEELKEKPLVMFCTGGIRCEKAGPFMEQQGFKEVYQLDGGILKYFEDCGGDHYDGDCFVFDQRVALDPNLKESPVVQCYACLTPLSVEDQQSEHYVAGKSCLHCFERPAMKMAAVIARRHESIKDKTSPLPGSIPYDNRRPINVSQRFDHKQLKDVLAAAMPHIPEAKWQDLVTNGQLIDSFDKAVSLEQTVRGGEQFFHLSPATIEPDVNANIEILFEDRDLVVVNKPAPLPMHPCGRFNRSSLTHILNEVYHPMRVRPAHRLDANTSGVAVLSRSKKVAAKIQPQFEKREVVKVYLAKIQGHPEDDRFSCDAPISENPGPAGAREIDPEGLTARTEFEVVKRCDDGHSIVKAKPLTGRTNQIRIHLWHLEMPIVGDATYKSGREIANTQTLSLAEAPLCLHSLSIQFKHPIAGQALSFEAPAPDWAL